MLTYKEQLTAILEEVKDDNCLAPQVKSFKLLLDKKFEARCIICGGKGHTIKFCATKDTITKNTSQDPKRSWLWKRLKTDVQHSTKLSFIQKFHPQPKKDEEEKMELDDGGVPKPIVLTPWKV